MQSVRSGFAHVLSTLFALGLAAGHAGAATDEAVRLAVTGGPAAGRLLLAASAETALEGEVLRLVALPPGATAAELRITGGAEAGLTARAGEPMIMRGLTVLPLLVAGDGAGHRPAATRPLELEVRYRAGAEAPVAAAFEHSAGFFAPFLDLFPAEQREALRASAEGGYLIVTAPQFTATLAPFIAWKREMGFEVTVVTTTETGTRNDQIRAWIRNRYETATVPPQYLALVGDVEQVPAFDYNQNVSDHPYALLEGDDFLPDLEVGRLSARTTLELSTIVAKLVRYEQNPERVDPSWFQRALLVAGNYSSSTPVPVMRWSRDQLHRTGYAQVDSVYYPPHWSTGPLLIRPIIDRGVSLVAYRGWAYGWQGWEPPKFTVEHIPSLANGWRLPAVFSFVCLNGDFAQPECFGEAWLRSGTASEPRGAVAFIGNSEHWSHTRFNDAAAIGAFRAIGGRGERRLGGILNACKFEVMAQFPDIMRFADHGEESVEFYFHIYSLLGDPALNLWMAAPDSVLVTHAAAIPSGSSLLEVTVRRLDGSTPVPGARIGVSQDGTVLGTALTDDAGVARVIAGFERTDAPLTVVATGAGILPYRASVPVVAGGPYLALSTVGVRDDGTAGSLGNGDGVPNPGETLALELVLENRGSAPAPAGTATLTALGGAFVEAGTGSFGAILPGATGAITPLLVRLDPAAEDGLVARFRLAAFSGADGSVSGFTLAVVAPALRYVAHAIGGGQVVSPGDTVEVTVTVTNDGAITASAAAAVLRSLTPGIAVVVDSTAAFPTLAPGATATASEPFLIAAQGEVPIGQAASFVLVATTGEGYASQTSFSVRLGPVDHRAPLGPDAYGYYAVDNTDTDYPNVAPTYEWVTCSPVYGGSGTQLPLGDNTTMTVQLPFDFKHYGRTYRHLLVSDNGWAAFDTTSYYDYYNWSMPNSYGCGAQVAPFWDNLDPTKAHEGVRVGDGIYVFHDAARQRFVVEWSRLGNYFSQHPNHNDFDDLQTFQLILFDPIAYPTPTGDGIIRFQYKQIFNNDVDRMFSTVGIENEEEDVGIEYTYSNLYPDRAAPLSAGLAIDFTTATPRYQPFRLAAFRASPSAAGVHLAWQPADERPRAGYRIYREAASGKRHLVAGGDLGSSAREFLDASAPPGEAAIYWIGALDPVGHETLLGPYAYAGPAAAPPALTLAVAGLNPFAEATQLAVSVPAPGPVSLRIYAVSGRLVRTLLDGRMEAGPQAVAWDGRDESGRALPSGVYIGRLSAAAEERELKLVLLR